MKFKIALHYFFIFFLLFSFCSTAQENVTPKSPTSSYENILLDWKSSSWNEIPIAVIDNKLIFAKTKNQNDKDLDSRKSRVEFYEIDINDEQLSIQPFSFAFPKHTIINDFLKPRSYDLSLYFTAKRKNQFQLFSIDSNSDVYDKKSLKRIDLGREVIHPTFNERGDKLVFASKVKGRGYDLFIAKKIKNKWTVDPFPYNTKFDETNPQYIKTQTGKELLVFKTNAVLKNKGSNFQEKIEVDHSDNEYIKNDRNRIFISPEGESPFPDTRLNNLNAESIFTIYDKIKCVYHEFIGVKKENTLDIIHHKISMECDSTIRYFALLIGINNYDDPSIKDLEQPVISINNIEGSLSRWNFERPEVLPNASKGLILGWLDKMKSDLRENDYLLVYYNGHGFKSEDSIWYLMPADGVKNDIKNTGISIRDIHLYFDEIQSHQLLFIADACLIGKNVSKGVFEQNDKKSRRIITVDDQDGYIDDTNCLSEAITDFLNNKKEDFDSQELLNSIKKPFEKCYQKDNPILFDTIFGKGGAGYFVFRKKK